ncbi:hypothetical protein jaqu_22160 [Jannaschia aquimarina]|uniref:Uncharacterized protein n=1 Tax=Jannaschia aquimarina TaxID=935700 RepID=A0A0D1D7J4_9RHOB|nr:hypothetical protein jaqu_22160 [Jannaschia aquimarina]SNS98465.1 hypothetical protein SAMN05421775_104127 [Jannaschia aquimarina]
MQDATIAGASLQSRIVGASIQAGPPFGLHFDLPTGQPLRGDRSAHRVRTDFPVTGVR